MAGSGNHAPGSRQGIRKDGRLTIKEGVRLTELAVAAEQKAAALQAEIDASKLRESALRSELQSIKHKLSASEARVAELERMLRSPSPPSHIEYEGD